ncbi:Transposase IS66 family protein [Maioricimonas rarisocia]|uniref:Transposase IS66 family protein n=1 Tax=Maioricimonas rarisocia TaxID=2528026 RepID=A0A517Z029_9PLAN|nr:IS66 family transposase [Maioricimonas rarisocia]QDU35854.1 Transposase IS66 family protein [Maioricimonas rarisocia]
MPARKPTDEALVQRIGQLEADVRVRDERIAALTAENEQLRRENTELKDRLARLEATVQALEEKLQESKRQAGPFRRRETLKKPAEKKKRPGRRKGHKAAWRPRPPEIDREINVPLCGCPNCKGELTGLRKREQIIEEIPPVRPESIKLTTWTATCPNCGEVESNHPLQTSRAVGAAGTHLGPRAQALAVVLAHQMGLPMRRTCEILETLCGLKLTPGGLAQLLKRAAGRVGSLYADILHRVRESDAVFADETSWYVGEPKWWLWVFTTDEVTLYRVEPGRSSDVVLDTLGEDFGGMLVSDCLASYNAINCRKHKCIAHHLRVLAEHVQTLEKRGIHSDYLMLWKTLLRDVITTYDDRQRMSAEEYGLKSLQLFRGVTNLLDRSPPEPEEVAFRNRLAKQRDHLLGCLGEPAAEPTNNRAERDLRPAVISRKLSCGNRTIAGKQAWERLRSVTETLRKQGVAVADSLVPYFSLAPQ